MHTIDAYQDFLRDWEGCSIKARQVKENPGFTRGVEKHGIIFEFHTDDLRRLSSDSDERDRVLGRIIRDGIDNDATLIAHGTRYPVYDLEQSEAFVIGEDGYVHA